MNILTAYHPPILPPALDSGPPLITVQAQHWLEGLWASLDCVLAQTRRISSEEVRRAVFIYSPSLSFLCDDHKGKKKKTGKAMRAYSPQEKWTRSLLLVLTLFHFHFNLKFGTLLFFPLDCPWTSRFLFAIKKTKGKLY